MYGTPNNKPLELTFDWIFDRISQEEVFLRYLGFCEIGKKFNNPLRKDSKPDCSFYWHLGTLFFNDIAKKKAYTCVTVVMEILKLNYFEALDQIYNEFINLKSNNFTLPTINRNFKTKEYKNIEVRIQQFTIKDINYLKQFGITSEFCKKAKWFSIKHYWINGELKYTYSEYNPCIGYFFQTEKKWKLYFYLNKEFRFISNTNFNIIQGYDILPETENLLIITKSFKDIGTLYEQNILSIAPQAESVLIQENIILNLKKRFKEIYTLFDYDNTGIHLAWLMKKLYGIQPYFLTNKLWNRKGGYKNCKDISDYRKMYGKEKTKVLIDENRNRFK